MRRHFYVRRQTPEEGGEPSTAPRERPVRVRPRLLNFREYIVSTRQWSPSRRKNYSQNKYFSVVYRRFMRYVRRHIRWGNGVLAPVPSLPSVAEVSEVARKDRSLRTRSSKLHHLSWSLPSVGPSPPQRAHV